MSERLTTGSKREQEEFGIGFMWRRKLRNFKDIFRFKNTDDASVVQPSSKPKRDSLINFTK